MAIYNIRIVKDGRTVLRRQLSEGASKTDAVVIKALPKQVYLLTDSLNGNGPAKILSKRVGQDLHVAIAPNRPEIPDFVIEGYFNFPPAPLLGGLGDGGQAVYDLGWGSDTTAGAPTANSEAAASAMADNAVVQSELPGASAGLSFWPVAGILGVGAAAAYSMSQNNSSNSTSSSTPSTTTDAATTALQKISTYSANSSQSSPTTSDYATAGVSGVSSSNLSAINSAVAAIHSGTTFTSASAVQPLVTAYIKILAEANGSTADATLSSNPLVSDYQAIGASIDLAATNSHALSLLNDVIGSLDTTGVDSITEINALATVVGKVINLANTGSSTTLSVNDLALLGLPTAGAGNVNSSNISAINSAIAVTGSDTRVDSLSELNALVQAEATLINYAGDSTQTAPTVDQYNTLGITGVSSGNLSSINSALATLNASKVDTRAEMQTVVDTYNLILAEANGSTTDATPSSNPTADQYALIGASIGAAATTTENLSLLNDSLASLSSTSVDTIAEINALASASNAVITTAAGGAKATLAQLNLLGLSGVSINNLLAVQNAIANTADNGLQVDTFGELQTLVTTAANAQSSSQVLIQNYASSSSNTTPTENDYSNIGVTGVDSSNLGSINSAVDALSNSNVDTPYKVQTVADAYNKILAEANGSTADATPSANPTANDYSSIGASVGLAATGQAGGSNLAASALSLLNDAIANMNSSSVDSVSKLNALGALVDKAMNLAALDSSASIPTGGLSMSDLSALGVDTALADQPAESDAILQAIRDTANTGTGIQTILALQAIVTNHAS